jgi:hypothetical protein
MTKTKMGFVCMCLTVIVNFAMVSFWDNEPLFKSFCEVFGTQAEMLSVLVHEPGL